MEAKIDLYTQSRAYSNDCLLEANNDIQATSKWLNLYKDKVTTYNTYKREAMRFILWCTYETGKNFTALKVDDLEEYLEFLQNPPPSWCTTRAAIRAGKSFGSWMPFIGPLRLSAYQCSVRVLNSLFNYLVQADYLRTNPIKLIRAANKFTIDSEDRKYQVWSRMLEADEWEAILQVLNTLPTKTKEDIDLKIRTQFLFACLYLLGLRIHEVAGHSWNAFRQKDGKWWFFVKGKGDKPAHIPVNDQLLEYVKAYRQHLGKDAFPAAYEEDPLIVSRKTGKAYQLRILYNMVKDVGLKASLQFEHSKHKQEKLRKFSPHWLRHMAASHQYKAGMSMSMIQENLRHASVNTTRIYLHSEDEARHFAIQNIIFNNCVSIDASGIAPQEQILMLKIKSKGIDGQKSFARFITSLEQNVLRNVQFKAVKSMDVMLEEFAQTDKFGGVYVTQYVIDEIQAEADVLIKMIQREAEIRLLSVSVKI